MESKILPPNISTLQKVYAFLNILSWVLFGIVVIIGLFIYIQIGNTPETTDSLYQNALAISNYQKAAAPFIPLIYFGLTLAVADSLISFALFCIKRKLNHKNRDTKNLALLLSLIGILFLIFYLINILFF